MLAVRHRSFSGCRFTLNLLFLVFLCFTAIFAHAESHVLVIQVHSADGQPLRGIQLQVLGGGSGISDNQGKLRIRLAQETPEGANVDIDIVHAKTGPRYEIFQPIDKRIRVPPFREESNNYASVYVAKVGDKATLSIDGAVKILVYGIAGSKTNDVSHVRSPRGLQVRSPEITLEDIASRLELPVADVRKASSKFEERSTDPYDKAVAEMAQGHSKEAAVLYHQSLDESAKTAHQALAKEYAAAYAAGIAENASGQIDAALKDMKLALRLRPDSAEAMLGTGITLYVSDQPVDGIKYLRKAHELAITQDGIKSSKAAFYGEVLAGVLLEVGQFADAKKLLDDSEDSVKVDFGKLSQQMAMLHWTRARVLMAEADSIPVNLTGTLIDVGALEGVRAEQKNAENEMAQSIEIYSRKPSDFNSSLVAARAFMGNILLSEGDFASSKICALSSLSIQKDGRKAKLPETADTLIQLGSAQMYLRELDEAKIDFDDAESIVSQTTGSSSSLFADLLRKKAFLSECSGEKDEAKELLRREIEIDTVNQGPQGYRTKESQRLIQLFDSQDFNPKIILSGALEPNTHHILSISILCPPK